MFLLYFMCNVLVGSLFQIICDSPVCEFDLPKSNKQRNL